MKAARAAWFNQFLDHAMDRFVFIDEFGAATNMARTHARAPRGHRAVCATPAGHWKVLSTIAAMTTGGVLCSASFAGATDGELFNAFVEDALKPLLRPGQVVVLDNLSVHRSAKARRLIESAGCQLVLLPPYSPDLNPIEQAFSKVKSALRSAEARTAEKLLREIGIALGTVSAENATAYIRHCGYSATPMRNSL